MITFNNIAEEVAKELIFQSALEIQQQGHKATSKLIQSLTDQLSIKSNSTVINIIGEDYGEYVDTGREANKKQTPIEKLIEWVKVRGIASTNKLVRQIAWAIAKNIVKEGIPSKGSFKHSRNGRRTGWIKESIKKSNIEKIITDSGIEEIDRVVIELANDLARSLNGKVVA